VLLAGMAAGILYLPRLVQGEDLRYRRPSDIQAMHWIEENAKEDALFLVDSMSIDWSPGWVVGLDAGYWIPLLAQRSTTVPPMIYPLEWGDPDRLPALLEASQEFLAWKAGELTSLQAILRGHGITHVFVSLQPNRPCLTEIGPTPGLQEICRLDRFRIYEVLP